MLSAIKKKDFEYENNTGKMVSKGKSSEFSCFSY